VSRLNSRQWLPENHSIAACDVFSVVVPFADNLCIQAQMYEK
jgi:hypothetical protein